MNRRKPLKRNDLRRARMVGLMVLLGAPWMFVLTALGRRVWPLQIELEPLTFIDGWDMVLDFGFTGGLVFGALLLIVSFVGPILLRPENGDVGGPNGTGNQQRESCSAGAHNPRIEPDAAGASDGREE